MDSIDLLLLIAKKGLHDYELFTTQSLAIQLNCTQQTISNQLRLLEGTGLIMRKPTTKGTYVCISKKGRHMLIDYRDQLSIILQSTNSIKGKLYTGLGEGKFYIQLMGYKKELMKLDIDPYPGTLNIRVNRNDRARFLQGKKRLRIKGFRARDRTFGALDCYLVKIKDHHAAITIPERTIHKDTLEIVSNMNLRKVLGLKNGDIVEVIG